MTSTDPGLFHRVLPPRSGDKKGPHPAIVLLHGRGADEQDLLGISSFLDPRFLMVSIRAPFPFGFGGGYTWYDMSEDGTPDPQMFRESHGRLTAFLGGALQSYPVDPRQIFLFGFSMGSMMALILALTTPGMFRGVIANSGYVPEKTGMTLKWDELSDTAFFISHGTHDPVVPVTLGRRTRDQFKRSNAAWVYREYPMGHEIGTDGLLEMSDWLTARIASQQQTA